MREKSSKANGLHVGLLNRIPRHPDFACFPNASDLYTSMIFLRLPDAVLFTASAGLTLYVITGRKIHEI